VEAPSPFLPFFFLLFGAIPKQTSWFRLRSRNLEFTHALNLTW
jgi:hypothetical protein